MKQNTAFIFVLLSVLSVDSAWARPPIAVSEAPAISIAECPGTADYVEIWNASDLARITDDMLANNSPNLKYRQCADIVLPSGGFLPIGYHADGRIVPNAFLGEYRGQGFRISGQRPPANFTGEFGLFRWLHGARINNVTIEGSYYDGIRSAGALAVSITNSLIDSVTIQDVVIRSTSPNLTGPFAGQIRSSILDNIKVEATVYGHTGMVDLISDSHLSRIDLDVRRDEGANISRFSGMADIISNSSVEHVRAKVSLTVGAGAAAGITYTLRNSHLSDVIVSDSNLMGSSGASSAAGIAVYALSDSLIERVRVYANLSAGYQVGGLLACSMASTVRDSLFEGSIVSRGDAGGIVGQGGVGSVVGGELRGTIIERCAVRNASISGFQATGGIVGTLLSSFAAPIPSRISDVAAEVSLENGRFSESYSTLGGIVGTADPFLISRAIFTGTAEHIEDSGGIIGTSWSETIIEDGIYNSDLVPLSNGFGTAASTQEMLDGASLYSSFDLLDTWVFTPGDYPELRSVLSLRADIDGDTFISRQDIFTFLTLYFAQSPLADFRQDNIIDTSDIYAFLSAWYAAE